MWKNHPDFQALSILRASSQTCAGTSLELALTLFKRLVQHPLRESNTLLCMMSALGCGAQPSMLLRVSHAEDCDKGAVNVLSGTVSRSANRMNPESFLESQEAGKSTLWTNAGQD